MSGHQRVEPLTRPRVAFNVPLARLLAWRGLRRHVMVAVPTVGGIAIGVAVVCSILIVDANTDRRATVRATAGGSGIAVIDAISFERRRDSAESPRSVPSQATSPDTTRGAAAARGEADYQAMRFAVRLASVFAFLVGAVIVFYTMRYSVAVRARAFSLLRCLVESRRNVAVSVLLEALMLSTAGTLLGAILAVPLGATLLGRSISTNGRLSLPGFAMPWGEITAMGAIGISVALLGVIGPIRGLYTQRIATVLQPRFLAESGEAHESRIGALMWLWPPALGALYVAARPFLASWLSVIQLFLIEGVIVVLLAGLTLWLVSPILRGTIGLFETILRPAFPLETLLAGRRLRLASRRVVFSVAGVSLVFALLTGLHDVTRTLKDEVSRWSAEALLPYVFLEQIGPSRPIDDAALSDSAAAAGAHVFRLSAKIEGAFPLRLVRGR